MLTRVLDGWRRLFTGLGNVSASRMDPGNRGNAPAPAPVQVGNYEFIQPYYFPNMDVTSIGSVPPMFRDWSAYPVNEFGLSGLIGGGATDATAVHEPTDPALFFDEASQQYYHLPTGN